MNNFKRHLAAARDAWYLLSWLIWPDNERSGDRADPARLHKLANALDHRGVKGKAATWPSSLRHVADRWSAWLENETKDLMRCPQCGSGNLCVSTDVTCDVYPKRSDNGDWYNAVEPIDGFEPHWTSDSYCSCQICGFDGDVRYFEGFASSDENGEAP